MAYPPAPDALQSAYQGNWTYRSLLNIPQLETPFDDLEFGRGTFTFGSVADDQITEAEADFGDGYRLTIRGELVREHGAITGARWRGVGVAGTPTEGWIYDYEGRLTFRWPEGVDQAVVITGSVLRTVRHGNAPAGVVGSFYMVKLP